MRKNAAGGDHRLDDAMDIWRGLFDHRDRSAGLDDDEQMLKLGRRCPDSHWRCVTAPGVNDDASAEQHRIHRGQRRDGCVRRKAAVFGEEGCNTGTVEAFDADAVGCRNEVCLSIVGHLMEGPAGASGFVPTPNIGVTPGFRAWIGQALSLDQGQGGSAIPPRRVVRGRQG